jgi:ribosome-binding factor A
MDSIRQQKIGKMIQTEMADMLLKDFRHLCGKSLVTVTHSRVTPDLGIARIYLSIFATEDKNAVLNHFVNHISEIRYTLGKRIRHQVRIIPELQFYIDDSLDYIERIDKALKK